jgi:hypothetical protein
VGHPLSRRGNKNREIGGPPASTDIVCVINGQYVGIEAKATDGKQSDHQKAFQENLEAAGGKYILAYTLDDVLAAL